MFSMKYFVIGACSAYALLALVILSLPKSHTSCKLGDSCISFCCAKGKSCNENSIRNDYTRSHPDLKDDTKFVFGDLGCEMERLTSEWNLNEHDNIETDDNFYDETEYCLANGSDSGWDAFVCKKQNNLKEWTERVFVFITSTLSFGLLVVTVIIYAAFKDLRTVFGKSSMLFVTGLTIIHFPFFFNEFVHLRMQTEMTFMTIGFVFSYCWLTVMAFDTWWTLKKREDPSVAENSRRFLFYCAFSFGLTLEVMLRDFYFTDSSRSDFRSIAPVFVRLVAFIYVITVLLNILFLVLAAFTVFRLSLKTNHQDASRFTAEKEKFWTCAQVFAVLLISSVLAVVLGVKQPIGGAFFGGVILSFLDFMIFSIFVFKPSVRHILFNRYGILENFLGD